MPSNPVFKSRSYAKRIDHSASSKGFEIEQCLYNLSEDFTRQTNLNDGTQSAFYCSADLDAQANAQNAAIDAPAPAPQVLQLSDILRHPISDDILNKLCFSEMLLVCDGTERIVGGAAINVSLIAGEVLAAFSSTRLSFLGQSTAESELMSFADRNGRPLQERKCETLVSNTTRQEKQLQLYFDDDHNVTAFRQESNGLHTESYHAIIKPAQGNGQEVAKQQNIIPDGLQLLLLRYLILRQFVGEISSQTVDVQGRVGTCIHIIAPAVPMKLDGNISETMKEVRKITKFSDGSEPEESVSHYSSSGRLLRHGWNSSNYILITSPLGTAPPAHITELERSIKDYVEALSGLIKNNSSIRELIQEIDCSVKDMNAWNQIVNPVLLEIIKDL